MAEDKRDPFSRKNDIENKTKQKTKQTRSFFLGVPKLNIKKQPFLFVHKFDALRII